MLKFYCFLNKAFYICRQFPSAFLWRQSDGICVTSLNIMLQVEFQILVAENLYNNSKS
jgi:hypothetical protein